MIPKGVNAMSSLEEKTQLLLEKVNEVTSPAVRALEISAFVSKGLREGELDLYEAYLLSGVQLDFERLAYTQSDWPKQVQISTLVQLLNLRLLAAAFGETRDEARWVRYGQEALPLNREKRPHYILDHYKDYLKESIPPQRLRELAALRKSKKQPFDQGPYHTELFPYEYCSCEEMLLRGETFPPESKCLSAPVEDAVTELALLLWS